MKNTYYWENKEKMKEYFKEYHVKNRKRRLLSMKEYRKNNKAKCDALTKKWQQENPIKTRLMKVMGGIRQRCNNENFKQFKNYGGKGIKCNITFKQLLFLWERDKAYELTSPCVDRIDNDGDYNIKNCRFIEKNLNRKKQKEDNSITKKDQNNIIDKINKIHFDKKIPFTEIARKIGVSRNTLMNWRYFKYSIQKKDSKRIMEVIKDDNY